MKTSILFLLCVLLTLQSCLKDDIGNSNQDVFQFIWDDMDQKYGGFAARGIDWDAAYRTYSPMAAAAETELDLFDACAEMIDILDDQHVFIYSNNLDTGFASGKKGDEVIAELGFDASVVTRNYVEVIDSIVVEDESFLYGTVSNDNIGYIYIPNFGFEDVRWFEEIDDILFQLKDTEGLILDLRNNGGGSPIIDRYLASRFVLEEKFVFSIQTRNGPERTDFDDPIQYFARQEGANPYTKSTVLLINHSTVSAGEEFALFLETQPHVTVVGDTTSNAFATETFVRLLPNSWELGFPAQLYLYPDGSSPEGVGIIPDIYLRNDTLDIQNGIDRVLEKGIDLL